MANASAGPIFVSGNSVGEINLALLQILERIDAALGLRGPTRIFARLQVESAVDPGDAVNMGSLSLLLDEANLFAESSQAQGIKEVLHAVQEVMAGSLLTIEADRRRAEAELRNVLDQVDVSMEAERRRGEAEIRNALDQADLASVFLPASAPWLGNDVPLPVETAAAAGSAPRSAHVDHVHQGVNLDDAQTITGTKTLNSPLDHDGTTVGFYGTTPVAQAVATANLTDNSGGTANDTIEALTSGTVYATDVAAIRNNFADLAAKVNIALAVLRALGLMAT